MSLRALENFSDRNILILGVLILVLLTIAYYFLLLNPLRQEYLARYEERTQKEAQEAQLEQTVAKLENVRRNAPNIERQILEYSKRIPEQDEIPTLVVQIEEVAEEAGVTQLSIEPGDPEAPPTSGDFSRIPLTMSFEGTYEEMQDFVLRIRNLARLVTVNGVTYCRFPQREGAECPIEQPGEVRGRTTRDSRGDLLTVEIAAEVYVQPAASEATTTADETTVPAGEGAPKAGEGKVGGGKAGEGKTGGSKTGEGKAGGKS